MSNPDSDQRPSAAGLLRDLKDTFAGLANTNWFSGEDSAKQVAASPAPVEDPAKAKKVEEVVAPVPEPPALVSAEDAAPDWLTPLVVENETDQSQVVLAESSAETMVRPPAAPTVVGLNLSEEDSNLKTLRPDDFSSKEKVEASPVVIISKSEEEKAEVDPFAGIKEFNGQMELIRQAQQLLTSAGILSSEGARQALLAVAKANSLLPKLPEDLLKSVILMKAVASNNPKYGREDFQREMLAVVDQVRGGTIKKA